MWADSAPFAVDEVANQPSIPDLAVAKSRDFDGEQSIVLEDSTDFSEFLQGGGEVEQRIEDGHDVKVFRGIGSLAKCAARKVRAGAGSRQLSSYRGSFDAMHTPRGSAEVLKERAGGASDVQKCPRAFELLDRAGFSLERAPAVGIEKIEVVLAYELVVESPNV